MQQLIVVLSPPCREGQLHSQKYPYWQNLLSWLVNPSACQSGIPTGSGVITYILCLDIFPTSSLQKIEKTFEMLTDMFSTTQTPHTWMRCCAQTAPPNPHNPTATYSKTALKSAAIILNRTTTCCSKSGFLWSNGS